ncbi:hypothetical protein SKAU_G00072670 [Synaphobranchus kaupii]|uniref:Uncharacterized protein n=1 Tax=Synaphobranchus kaupii TaxID=118154 RepID=A0A9Q1G726_SYNKA|nr:hypothetical protein SKAU_G00072670 [Synaphobranchus kaupii]
MVRVRKEKAFQWSAVIHVLSPLRSFQNDTEVTDSHQSTRQKQGTIRNHTPQKPVPSRPTPPPRLDDGGLQNWHSYFCHSSLTRRRRRVDLTLHSTAFAFDGRNSLETGKAKRDRAESVFHRGIMGPEKNVMLRGTFHEQQI